MMRYARLEKVYHHDQMAPSIGTRSDDDATETAYHDEPERF